MTFKDFKVRANPGRRKRYPRDLVFKSYSQPPIAPLQLVIHVVKKSAVLESKRQDKKLTSFKMVISFVCLVSVHLLISSIALLYHGNDCLLTESGASGNLAKGRDFNRDSVTRFG